jgi:hypothetical protein
MGGSGDEATAKIAAEKFEALKGNPSGDAVPADLKGLVYTMAAANGGVQAFETLVSMFQDPDTMSEEKVRILQSLGSTKDPALQVRLWDVAMDGYAIGGYEMYHSSCSDLLACAAGSCAGDAVG